MITTAFILLKEMLIKYWIVPATDVNRFTAQFSAINHVRDDLQIFTNQQLEKSYDFLLLSFTFDKYELDRPGFEKLYRKISDKAWEDTVGLIKYQSKRGLSVTLNGVQSIGRFKF